MSKRLFKIAIVGVVLSVVGTLAVGWALSRPVPARIGAAPPDLHAEDVSYASASGSTIHGWLSRGDAHGGAVLLLPGVRSNRLGMVDRARVLRAAGYSTLLIDFQATGESPGDAITFGWRERLDVIGAVKVMKHELPGEHIGIVGTSLGGAATLLAADQIDIQAAVLEAVYPSIDVAVENRLRIRLGAAGAAMSPLLLMQLRPRLGVSPADLRPIDHIASLRCPILIIGGDVDLHTTLTDTQHLYAAAQPPKDLWLVHGASHVDLLTAAGDEYRKRVLAFLEHALRPADPQVDGDARAPAAIRGSGGFQARQIPSPPVADGKEWIAADVVVGNPETSIEARNRTFSLTFREAPGHGGDVERFKLFLQRGRDAPVQIDVNLTAWVYVTPDDRWVFTEPLYALDVREWKQYPLFDVFGIPNYTTLESISKDGRRMIVSRTGCAYDCAGLNLPRFYYELTLPK